MWFCKISQQKCVILQYEAGILGLKKNFAKDLFYDKIIEKAVFVRVAILQQLFMIFPTNLQIYKKLSNFRKSWFVEIWVFSNKNVAFTSKFQNLQFIIKSQVLLK